MIHFLSSISLLEFLATAQTIIELLHNRVSGNMLNHNILNRCDCNLCVFVRHPMSQPIIPLLPVSVSSFQNIVLTGRLSHKNTFMIKSYHNGLLY